MTTAELPSTCATALKEWATVLEAMARGEQLVLIRKGGLVEPGRGFELLSPTFAFYPTFEHQAVGYLRPPYQRYFEEALRRRALEGEVHLELVGQAVSSVRCADSTVVERLRDFHVYNEAFVRQRLKWQPAEPLVIVVVRVLRLAAPHTVPVVSRYAGCTSWVELDSPIPLAGAQPILDETAFRQRAKALDELLSPGA